MLPNQADLPHDTILSKICNMSTILKAPSSGIPPTVVGEWSLETGSSLSYLPPLFSKPSTPC
jgi:hypothetical protein